jgi:hypothetical protein
LKDAYIINQYDLENEAAQVATEKKVDKSILTKNVYSIQLKATKSPIDISKIFPGYEGVKEISNGDGFYKYVFGEYESIAKAREILSDVKKDFEDAFIREISIPIK